MRIELTRDAGGPHGVHTVYNVFQVWFVGRSLHYTVEGDTHVYTLKLAEVARITTGRATR